MLVFSRTASGNVAPTRVLSGGNTQLTTFATGVVVDPINNELFVANNNNTITVYSRTATGNTVPIRVLAGSATGLTGGLVGIAISTSASELYALTPTALNVYLLTAMGNTPPIRTLSLPLTQFSGLAFDAVNQELFLGRGNTVYVFPRTASGIMPSPPFPPGNSGSPSRSFSVSFTCGGGPLAVDPSAGEVFVLCSSPGITATFNIQVAARTASGTGATIRILQPRTTNVFISGMAVNSATGEISWAELSTPAAVYTQASSFQGTVRTIQGTATTLSDISPGAMAVGP